MARAGQQVKEFRTVAPPPRPVVLSARGANGGGKRTTGLSGSGHVVIGGSQRVLRPKGGGK